MKRPQIEYFFRPDIRAVGPDLRAGRSRRQACKEDAFSGAARERSYMHEMTTTSGGNISVRDESGDVFSFVWIRNAT